MLLTATAISSCQMPDLELAGRDCPCGSGWYCHQGLNMCVPLGNSHDADVDHTVDDADVGHILADADQVEHQDTDWHPPQRPCDWSAGISPFNVEPVSVTGVNSEWRHPSLSADGRSLYFVTFAAESPEFFIELTRENLEDPFQRPTDVYLGCWRLGRVADPSNGQPVFFSGVCGDATTGGSTDIQTASFGEGGQVSLGIGAFSELNSDDDESNPAVTSDGRAIYFSRMSVAGYGNPHIVMARRPLLSESFIFHDEEISAVNTEYTELSPTVTAGGEVLVFASDRPDSVGGFDLWYSRHSGEAYEAPRRIPFESHFNTAGDELEPALSADGCELYFITAAADTSILELHRAQFTP